jgi:hypothetical protein
VLEEELLHQRHFHLLGNFFDGKLCPHAASYGIVVQHENSLRTSGEDL